MRTRICLAVICHLLMPALWAQEGITENLKFERIIENLLPQQELEADYNDLYDRLFTLYTNPLDLNTAERNDFQSLFLLNEEQISGIINYRERFGKFLSIFELLTIEGFDKEVVQRLIPFVTIDFRPQTTLISGLNQPDIHEVFFRYQTIFEQKKGYTSPDTTRSGDLTSRYAGDPNRFYTRYLYAKKGLYSFGFTVEKDPGENITWEPSTSRYGLDYYSFHGMIENRGVFKKIIIGDFSMDSGQGLVFGSGIRIGKGAAPVFTIRRNSLGVRPYRSVYEYKDFSGIAVVANIKSIELSAFYSHVKRDAIIRQDSIDERDQYISYIQTVGLHRTPMEIAAKHQIRDQSLGGSLSFRSQDKKLEIGLNALFNYFNIPLYPQVRKYNQFEFRGKTNAIGSFYLNYYLKNVHIFSEVAASEDGGKAISTGAIANLSSQVQASIHYRNYAKNFHSFRGEAFRENSKIGNEEGIYWGLSITPVKRLKLATYFDLFRFPWLKYQVDAPSEGRDFMATALYEFNENLNF